MVLSFENDSDNESKPKPDGSDDESEPESNAFDVNDPGNIFASALLWAVLAKTLLEMEAESWFEEVNVKFEIYNLCNATIYQEIFESSGAWGINTCLLAHNCKTMYTEALQMISNFINGIHTGINTAQSVIFPGLPDNEQPLTDDAEAHFTNDEQDCYTVLVSSAVRMNWQRPYH